MTRFPTRYLIAGLFGVAALVAMPLVRCALAEGNHSTAESAAGLANAGHGGVCCSSQGNTYYALRRYDKEVFWKGDVLYSLARDIAHVLNLNTPVQRGAYNDGGPIMGSGARELRGPGGLIGSI